MILANLSHSCGGGAYRAGERSASIMKMTSKFYGFGNMKYPKFLYVAQVKNLESFTS